MNSKKVIIALLIACFAISTSFGQSSKETSVDPHIEVSKEVLTNLWISNNNDVETTSFKIKFPGYPTVLVKGNTLNEEALDHLKSAKKGTSIQVFDIKDDSSKGEGAKKNKPLIFRLTTRP